MDEKPAVAIDGVVALQRTLGPDALEALRQKHPHLVSQLVGQTAGISEDVTPREKSALR